MESFGTKANAIWPKPRLCRRWGVVGIMLAFMVVVSLVMVDRVAAALLTSTGSGQFSTVVGSPANGDDIVIATGHEVVLDVDLSAVTLKSIIIRSGATLRFDPGGLSIRVGINGLGRHLRVENGGTLQIDNGAIVGSNGAKMEFYGDLIIDASGGGIDGLPANCTVFGTGVVTLTEGELYCYVFSVNTGGIVNADGGGPIWVQANAIINGEITSTAAFSESTVMDVSSGTLTINGSIGVGGAAFSSNYSLASAPVINSGSTIEYCRLGNQTIASSLTYSNLVLAGNGTKTVGGALTINGNLTFDESAQFSNTTSALSIGGDITNNSNAAHAFGTATYTFPNSVTFSGSGSALNFGSAVCAFSGASITCNYPATLTFGSASFSNTNVSLSIAAGTVSFNSAASFSGSNAQVAVSGGTTNWTSLTMSGTTSNVDLTNTAGKNTFTGNVSLANNLHIHAETDIAGQLQVGNEFLVTSSTGSGDDINTFGGVVNATGSVVTLSGGGNTFMGNFTQNNNGAGSTCSLGGVLTASAGGTTVSLAAENVSFSGTLAFNNLQVSNANGSFVAEGDFSIANTLALAKDVSMPFNTVTFGSSSPAGCISGVGNIFGTVRRQLTAASSGSYDFNSATCGLTVPLGGFSSGVVVASTLNQGLADAQAVNRYYEIEVIGTPGFAPNGNFALDLEYADDELNGNNEGGLKLWYGNWAAAGEGAFTLLSSSAVNTSTNYVHYAFDGVMALRKRYTLADQTQPLPVELTAFSARYAHNAVHLSWKTATEVDNYGFYVERRTQDGEFREIAFVEGNGTKNTPTDYACSDRDLPAVDLLVYRLRQVNRDGTADYSDEVAIAVRDVAAIALSNYPNPYNPTTTVTFMVPQTLYTTVKVYAEDGRHVATLFDGLAESGQRYYMPFESSELPGGAYVSILESGSYKETRTMILSK